MINKSVYFFSNTVWVEKTKSLVKLQHIKTAPLVLNSSIVPYILNNHRINYVYENKTIDSHFVSVSTDQIRRGDFEKRELDLVILRSIEPSLQAHMKPEKNSSGSPQPGDDRTKRHFKVKVTKQNKLFRRMVFMNLTGKKIVRKKGTLTRIRNRCIITGRSSIIGRLGISRISFRHLAHFGAIGGLVKI